MAMSSILSGAVGLDGSPAVDHAAALKEQTERRRRETLDIVPCPGCGGEAWAEREPVTVYRDGMMRRFRAATCKAGCRTEIRGRNPMSGRPNTRPTRFEIEISPEVVMETEKAAPERYRIERELVQDVMQALGLSQAAVARANQCSQPCLSTWLRTGEGLGPGPVARLIAWAQNETKDVAIKDPELPRHSGLAEAVELAIQIPLDAPPEDPERLRTLESAGGDETCQECLEMAHELGISSPGCRRCKAADNKPPVSPGDAIILDQLQHIAREHLANLSPAMAGRIKIIMSLEWKDPPPGAPGPTTRGVNQNDL